MTIWSFHSILGVYVEKWGCMKQKLSLLLLVKLGILARYFFLGAFFVHPTISTCTPINLNIPNLLLYFYILSFN